MVCFRTLYERILYYEGRELFSDVLFKWIDSNELVHLIFNGVKQLNPVLIRDQLTSEQSWELYALSRVLDLLTLQFQPNKNVHDLQWSGPNLSMSNYIKFVQSLNLEVVTSINSYTSFHYEILEANSGEGSVRIEEILYPTVMLGQLLIKRGGIIIACDEAEYNIPLINNSTIYWAHRRKNRKCNDLSRYWGHNSQWQTDFRFDYDCGEYYLYNSTGNTDLNLLDYTDLSSIANHGLDVDEAIEITINRHFLTCSKNDSDLFPYDYKYTQKVNIETAYER